MTAPAIRTDITLSLVVPGDDPLPVAAVLRYEASDPFAINLDIAAGEDVVTWSFARDLLTEGVEQPAGLGDIHIRPVAHPAGRRVRLELSSPDGAAVLEASLAQMVEFLTATYVAVPTGSELDHVDLDRAISLLLL